MKLNKLFILLCMVSCVPMACGQSPKGKKNTKSAVPSATVDYTQIGASLPAMKIYTIEGQRLTENDLKGEGNLIVMLFNPTCGHCEDQVLLLKEHRDKIQNHKLVLLAADNMVAHLGYFQQITGTAEMKEMILGVDSAAYIEQTFLQTTLPQLNVYNKDRKLVHIFQGLTPIDSLKSYLD
jgi:hypothetical protein